MGVQVQASGGRHVVDQLDGGGGEPTSGVCRSWRGGYRSPAFVPRPFCINAMSLTSYTKATKPFEGQKPGTSGLRKAVKVFEKVSVTKWLGVIVQYDRRHVNSRDHWFLQCQHGNGRELLDHISLSLLRYHL